MREDQAWTVVCVLCAAVVREGLPLYFCVCLFVLLNLFKCSPVPASFFPIYELCYKDNVRVRVIDNPEHHVLSVYTKNK